MPISRDKARAIYRKGEEAAVEALMKLSAENEKLKKENIMLKSKLEDTGRKETDISTPSGMTPPFEKKSSRRKRRKKRGRKKGHPGAHRAKPERIDEVKEHKLDNCPLCQKSLKDKKPVEIRKRYIENIRIESVVTEHQIYRYKCNNCHKIVEPPVTDALPKSNIGLDTIVLTNWMRYGLGIPTTKIVRMVNTIAEFKVTESGLYQSWHRLSDMLKSAYKEIGYQARNSNVIYADETGWRVYGISYWLWCLANKSLAYYAIHPSRASPALEKMLGKTFKGILASDFWGAYNAIEASAKQKCLVHLLRELAKTTLANSQPQWYAFAKKLKRLIADAIRLNVKELDSKTFEKRKKRIHTRLKNLIEIEYEDKDCKRLVKRLRRHQNELFTFLDHPEVDWHNNHVEKQLRPAVVARKNSGGNQSDSGAETQAIMMSIFFTLYLHGKNEIKTVIQMIKNYMINDPKPIMEN